MKQQSSDTGTKPNGKKTSSTAGVAAIGAVSAILVAAITNSDKLAPLLPWGHPQPAPSVAAPAINPTPAKTEPVPVVRSATKTGEAGKGERPKKAENAEKESEKAAEANATAERAAAEQAATAKTVADKAQGDRISTEKAAAEKAEADRIAREKAAATRPMLVLREITQIHNGFLHDNWTFEIRVNKQQFPDVPAHHFMASEQVLQVGSSGPIMWAPQPLVDDEPYVIQVTARQIGGSLTAQGSATALPEPNKTTHVHLKTAHAMTGGEFDFAFVVQR